MRRKKLSVLLVGLAMCLPAFSASSPGTSGGSVLSIPVGARAIGMGEAYTAMADDVSSLYWNPAGLALLNQSQASFMYNQWLQDLTYSNLAVATPLENGGLGASLSYLSYGKIQGYDDSGNPNGNINAYNGVATLGGAWLGDIWSLGANLKGVQGSLADVKATGFAGDLGATLMYPKEVMGGTIRMGATLRNLGTGLKYIDQIDPFPRELRVGIAALEMVDRKLNLSFDYGKQRDLDSAYYTGAEYWVMPKRVALRAGYVSSQAEGNGLRAGIGLRVKDLSFDYAFSSYGDLGMTHRYELTFRFGAIQPRLTPEERALFHRAKLAMAEGRYGEATELLDSLIQMEPRYKPFRRVIRTAMKGYEQQDEVNKSKFAYEYQPKLKSANSKDNDPNETAELEQLLSLSEEESHTAKATKGNKTLQEKN